ncbi:hypothetical protein L914_10790 [Phytophthora nicotianae]|uniref:HAT C-terminal dimerisation domain-containing protein n=1 Tax=Phytophthora nicotianae TaxID=4792 RepID=W2N7Q0_PHYNI|nr:hypothetical protein L914_10790 [Phytophthora nicotianae]
MDELLKAKQAIAEEKAILAKRRLQNAFDEAPDASKRLQNIHRCRFLKILVYENSSTLLPMLGGIILDSSGATQLQEDKIFIAAELRASLIAPIFSSCEYYCITTDIWTSRRAQSFMALTLHYTWTEDVMPCNRTLEMESFPGIHTGG